jgi:hypothetical protein
MKFNFWLQSTFENCEVLSVPLKNWTVMQPPSALTVVHVELLFTILLLVAAQRLIPLHAVSLPDVQYSMRWMGL